MLEVTHQSGGRNHNTGFATPRKGCLKFAKDQRSLSCTRRSSDDPHVPLR